MGFQDILHTRVARPSPLLIATTVATIFVAVPTFRLVILSRRLSRQISHHQTLTGDQARAILESSSDRASRPSNVLTVDANDDEDDASTFREASKRHGLASMSFPSSAALPTTLTASPKAHNIFYDISLLQLTPLTLPQTLLQHPHDLLTAYLHHTMTLFASTPQGWIIWAVAALSGDEQGRRSFEREWIESLGFERGDLVNGLYRVLERGNIVRRPSDGRTMQGGDDGARVVFEMKRGPVEGRLVVAIRQLDGAAARDSMLQQEGDDGEQSMSTRSKHEPEGQVVFSTETWMWVKKDVAVVMPMERAVPRFMHRLGSWWLLVSGTTWLQKLAR